LINEVTEITSGATSASNGGEAVNYTTTFTYDDNGNVKTRTEGGITSTYAYNLLNLPTTIVSQGGETTQTMTYVYDDMGNVKEVVYPKGNKDIFIYDNRNLLANKTIGNLTTICYNYNGNGNVNRMIDGESKTYNFNYDGHDRLKEVIDPLRNKVSCEYDAGSNVTAFAGIGIDGKTFNQDFDYDPLDRVTQQRVRKDNGDILSKYIYNIPDRKVSMVTPNQNQWDMTLTGSGLTKHLADPLGNRDDYAYDRRGWLSGKIENEAVGKNLTRTFSHTVLGAPDVTGDSIGRDYKQIYSRDRQLPEYILDPEKGLTSFAYDGLNRLSSEKRHIAYQGVIKEAGTTYNYDANGNLSIITDSENNITRYEYDSKDRLTDIFYPGTANEHITYNGRDQVLTYTDLNGTVITNTYDDAGRLIDITTAAAPGVEGPFNEHFEYDGLNRLTLASNSEADVRFVYDLAGRLQTEIQELKDGGEGGGGGGGGSVVATYTVNYRHDDNGNNTQITYPSGKVVVIAPDALDRISTIKDGSNTLIAGYTYEGKGKIRQKNIHNVITMDTAFDDGRRPLSMTYKNNQIQQVYIDKAMNWNKVDLKEFDLDYGKKDAYTYDSTYRLRKVDNKSDNAQYEYKLDELENLVAGTETKNGVTETKSAVTNERQQLVNYDGKNLTYDNNGNMTGFDKAGYFYNWKNQLVKVSTGTGLNLEYKYDALGRRIVKIIKAPESQSVIRYVHDGYRVIEERDEQDTLKYRYTYGNGIDERIEMEKREVKPDGTVAYKSYYLLHDSIGNVIGLTNAAGLLIEKYKYNPYGKVKFYNTENSPKVDSITIRDGKIKLYFDRPVDINNIDIQVVIIGSQQQIPIDIESSQSGRQYLLAPDSGPLPQDEPLNIKVNSKEDSTGSSFADQSTPLLSQDFVYHGGAVEVIHDQGAPRVESVTHEGNELLIEFNEDVKPASLSDHIELTYQGTAVSGSIGIIGDNQVKFTPDEPLSDTKQYSVKVTDVEDYAGKVIELFSLDFELNVESKMLFSYSILTESSHSIFGNNSLMHGRDYEPEVGLYYYRARYYHPELGRFLQPDPMGYEDSMNLYQGFGMNPANFTDPMGLEVLNRKQLEGAYWWTSNVSGMNFTFREFVNEYAKKKNQRVYLHKGKILFTYDPRNIDNEGDVITNDGGEYIHHNPTYTLIPIKHHKYGDRWNLMNDLKPNRREYGRQDYQNIHSFTHHFDSGNELQSPLLIESIKKSTIVTIAKYHARDREHALYVASGYRTFAQQQQAHASNPRGAAVAGRSWHNYGLAVDIVPQNQNGGPSWSEDFNWQQVGQIGLASGFREWGGNWQDPFDRPHYQNAYSDRVRDDVLGIYNSEGGGYRGVLAVQIFNDLMLNPFVNNNVQLATMLAQFFVN